MSLTQERTALSRLLAPALQSMTPEVARWLVEVRADPELQERLDTFADKCTEGELTAEERAEYESYVRAIGVISVLQAKARKLLAAQSRS